MSSELAAKVLTSLVAAALAYLSWKVTQTLVAPYRSSLRLLRGPPSISWIHGSFRVALDESEADKLFELWPRQYGASFAFHNTLNVRDSLSQRQRSLLMTDFCLGNRVIH